MRAGRERERERERETEEEEEGGRESVNGEYAAGRVRAGGWVPRPKPKDDSRRGERLCWAMGEEEGK